MVKVEFLRNKNNEIYQFTVKNHTDSIVCSAVSVLFLSTINSIESFTDEHFTLEYEDEGGFLFCSFPEIQKGSHNRDVNLLLNSLFLGVTGISEEYAGKILITDKGVQ